MHYDIFFSISQTPVNGVTPDEGTMFRNFFEQVVAADDLGFDTAWVAESHLSSEVQKTHRQPVIPHWEGEVGLNVDITQLAHQIFARTHRIEVGSAVMNILCNGGPIAHAERLAYFCALHGINPAERRRLHVGFSAGRFDFMNRASGIVPRNSVEEALGPVMKGKTFQEACEIFLRALRGDTFSSEDIPVQKVTRTDFRSDDHWEKVQAAYRAMHGGGDPECIGLEKRWTFESLKVVPQAWRRDLLQPIIGSHDPALQEHVNTLMPVQVFNLSITKPGIIEDTHQRMGKSYHPTGGPWKRYYMPRTVFVFLNEQPGLTPAQRRQSAQAEAKAALSAYWKALEGTLDPNKVEQASNNALIGNADDVAGQVLERFHPDDRLMLWFDFFNHDSRRVIDAMRAFKHEVVPKVQAAIEGKTSGVGR